MNKWVLLAIFFFSFAGILALSFLLPRSAPTPVPTFNTSYTPTPVSLPTNTQPFLSPSPSQEDPLHESPSPTQPSLSRKELIDLLPITTDSYNIEYFAASDEIVVTIKQEPYEENRKKSERWFIEKGFSDFDKARITWTALRFIQ